jgi:hypothetical protein
MRFRTRSFAVSTPGNYKLPKGLTFDYDDGTRKKTEDMQGNQKAQVEILYTSYQINKPVPDNLF